MTELRPRYELIDLLRGFAVLLMIIFHFFYDLDMFGFVDINFTKDLFWYWFPRFIVFLFLLCVGFSLCFVHSNGIKWANFGKRLGILVALAAGVSIATYIIFPENWIYMGILHCIALCSIAALPLVNWPRLSLFLGITLLALFSVDFIDFWPKMAHSSKDYIPFIPWVAIVFFGIAGFHAGIHKLQSPVFAYLRFLHPLGKHSLIIYVLHQPILIGAVYSVKTIVG